MSNPGKLIHDAVKLRYGDNHADLTDWQNIYHQMLKTTEEVFEALAETGLDCSDQQTARDAFDNVGWIRTLSDPTPVQKEAIRREVTDVLAASLLLAYSLGVTVDDAVAVAQGGVNRGVRDVIRR